jgi:hypothetical protein
MADLTEAERKMLAFSLDLAQEKIWSEDGFTEDDQKAIDRLRTFTVDGRTASLEHAVVQARYALAALCYDLDDPGTGALGALYIVQQASAGAPADYKDETEKVLAEHDATVIEGVAEKIGDDTWSRRDKWGRYEREEYEAGVRHAEEFTQALAEKRRKQT